MLVDIDISDWAAISPLGSSKETIWNSYLKPAHCLSLKDDWQGALGQTEELIVEKLANENLKYKSLDKSATLAIAAGRLLNKELIQADCGINLGSSRGATSQFEQHYQDFLSQEQCSPLASPTTTLGNLSSWLAQDLETKGIAISHSVTCSTALHSIANAAAWLQAGFSKQFVAGGSEAPLTPFTLAQMKAMRIYAKNQETQYPCKSYDLTKTNNSMVLGEGAALFLMEKNSPKPLAKIKAIGFATEQINHGSSISENGDSLQKSMQMALQDFDNKQINGIVMHTPGTIKGDMAEHNAIKHIFGDQHLLFSTNKWKIGHTLGASGAFSLAFAIQMLHHQQWIGLPWADNFNSEQKIDNLLVNAVGFGGNAVSLIVGL